VWREGLWKRLWDAGVRGKMWRVVRAMYMEVHSCVMVEGEKTEWFETLMGVRQGCVLSPILYSIFINGFAKELIERGVGGVEVGEDVLRLLLFADDIVLFAEDGQQLQQMLTVLEEYCRKWRFEINVGKSKVMVCGSPKQREGVEGRWGFAGKEMERVSMYKYVGVMVNEGGDWHSAVERVVKKGSKDSRLMEGWLGRHWEVSPRVKMDVWKGTVGAGMRYGSEVWFPGVLGGRSLEAVQLRMVKQMLRVGGKTADEFVRGEVGMFEVRRERDQAKLCGWGGWRRWGESGGRNGCSRRSGMLRRSEGGRI
jgi:hypothetical protein